MSLHVSVGNDWNGDQVRAFLEGGAPVNDRGGAGGNIPLHDACYNFCVDAVEPFLRWGVYEELTNAERRTAAEMVVIWLRRLIDGTPNQRMCNDGCIAGARSSRQVLTSPRLAGAGPHPFGEAACHN